MAAAKLYLLGGLMLALVVLLQVWYGNWPWEEPRATGLETVVASMVVHPIALTLAILALVLGLLQVYVVLPNRLKVVLAVAYLVGAVIFPRALYRALEIRGWELRPDKSIVVGLLLLGAVLLVNLAGVLRFPPKAKT